MLDKRKSSFGEEGVTMPGDLWGYEDGSDFGAGWPDAGEHGGGARRNSLRRRSSNASAGTIDNDEDRLISPDRRPSWFSSHRRSESGTGSSWFGGDRRRSSNRRRSSLGSVEENELMTLPGGQQDRRYSTEAPALEDASAQGLTRATRSQRPLGVLRTSPGHATRRTLQAILWGTGDNGEFRYDPAALC